LENGHAHNPHTNPWDDRLWHGDLLIASPWLFGFATGGIKQWLPVVLGLIVLLQSLITDYELSVARVIPMPMHLGLDAANGLLLAASPWLFGFADRVYLPHLLIGLFELAAVAMSDTRPERSRAFATHA
jgi:hypothetical protein